MVVQVVQKKKGTMNNTKWEVVQKKNTKWEMIVYKNNLHAP